MLVFVDEGCRPCEELAPAVLAWQRELRDHLAIEAVTTREIAAAYDARAFPSAVLLTRDGRIASRLAVGEPAIRVLVEAAAR
jgi:hypothetical protein